MLARLGAPIQVKCDGNFVVVDLSHFLKPDNDRFSCLAAERPRGIGAKRAKASIVTIAKTAFLFQLKTTHLIITPTVREHPWHLKR